MFRALHSPSLRRSTLSNVTARERHVKRLLGAGVRVQPLSTDADSQKASQQTKDDILRGWPGKYRFPINYLMRALDSDPDVIQKAKDKYIDEKAYKAYIGTFRRTIVKNPLIIMDSVDEVNSFCQMLDTVFGKYDPMDIFSFSEDSDFDVDGPELIKCKDFMTEKFLKNAEADMKDEIKAQKTLEKCSDLRIPHEWYPQTRLMKRKIIYHGGPTNSGKTYHALQRLKNADVEKGGGLFAGPLRLLALEVYERLNREGVYCNLLTGQERREVPGATHVASTLEMVNLKNTYDVVVIDEIQMIADKTRGFAWTRALLGLQANEIHLCGGLEAKEVVESLVKGCGDEFVLEEYKRMSTLRIMDESLQGDYAKVQPGDCVVAFSKSDLFSIKRQIEQLTAYRCAIIYGALPPETRSTQARLFNEEDSGYDILVASDAIGMGLNLNIRRIIIHSVIKKGGLLAPYWVDHSMVKQIGGRAGRRSSQYKVGEVTTWQEKDLAYLKACFDLEIPQAKAVGLFPSVDQVEKFSEYAEALYDLEGENETENESEEEALERLIDGRRGGEDAISRRMADTPEMFGPRGETNDDTKEKNSNLSHINQTTSLAALAAQSPRQAKSLKKKLDSGLYNIRVSTLLNRFVEMASLDGRFFLCEHTDLLQTANWLQTVPLSLEDRFVFANAPIMNRDNLSMDLIYQFAANYALGRPVALTIKLPAVPPRDMVEFSELCTKHHALDLYLWLSHRFPRFFIERESCEETKERCLKMIEGSLHSSNLQENFSHSSDFQKTREKLKDTIEFEAPPIEYGEELRKKTLQRLREMAHKKPFDFPRLFEEGQHAKESSPTVSLERVGVRRMSDEEELKERMQLQDKQRENLKAQQPHLKNAIFEPLSSAQRRREEASIRTPIRTKPLQSLAETGEPHTTKSILKSNRATEYVLAEGGKVSAEEVRRYEETHPHRRVHDLDNMKHLAEQSKLRGARRITKSGNLAVNRDQWRKAEDYFDRVEKLTGERQKGRPRGSRRQKVKKGKN